MPDQTHAAIRRSIAQGEADAIAFRRLLHMHPEVSYHEARTTAEIAARLTQRGLHPHVLDTGTGLTCDIPLGPSGASSGRIVALRADIDALAMQEQSDAPYRSQVAGVAHACGHDVHTAVLMAAGLALLDLAQSPESSDMDGVVRLIFEPAEETVPGGAVEVVRGGRLDGVAEIFALHCDPKIDCGQVGTRVGPLTAAADIATVTLSGPGGHTSRPHLTIDLVRELATVATSVPDRVRELAAGIGPVSMVFGAINAGDAANVIPATGELRASVRTPSTEAWAHCEEWVRTALAEVLDPRGVPWQLHYVVGVPPVVNVPASTERLRDAVISALGPDAAVTAPESNGGDSFAWYLQATTGTYGRLGTRPSAYDGPPIDLHAAGFDVDERCIAIGAEVLALAAVSSLRGG